MANLNLNWNTNGATKTRPLIPTDVVITVVSDTAFSVAYVSAKPAEIWYSTDNVTYTKHGDDTATPYPMTGLTQGTLYWIKIRAKNGSKYSAFGSAVSATTVLLAPTVLTSQFVVDTILGQVDFTDNSGGVAQHEVYSNTNAAGAVLLTTLATGIITYNDTTCKQNASVVYTVRAKKGTVYSTYATATALATPLCWKTDQTTRTNVIINALIVAAGKTVNIDWGDGVNANYTGSNSNITHTYDASATNIFNVVMSGDLDSITRFYHYTQVKSFGDLTNWKVNIDTFRIDGNAYTGDVSNWLVRAKCATFWIDNNQFTGKIPNIETSAVALSMQVNNNNLTGSNVTVFRVAQSRLYAQSQGLTFPKSELDSFFLAAANWYQNNAPTSNNIFDFRGDNMESPLNGDLNTDIVRLKGYFTSATKTATVYVNPYISDFLTVYKATELVDYTYNLVAHNGVYRVMMNTSFLMKYSSNNGVTYGDAFDLSTVVTSTANITKQGIRITNGGNVIIPVPLERKMIISDDECASFDDVAFLGADDNALSLHVPANASYPGGYFYFMEGFDIGVIDGQEVIVMGNYTNSQFGASPIYLYYSIDGGVTFKVFYEFGQNTAFTDDGTADGGIGGTLLGDSGNVLLTRHFHSVDFSLGKFIGCTGDADAGCLWLECDYNVIADTWSVTVLNTLREQRMRSLGVYQTATHYYWGGDGTSETGIFKCLKADIDTKANHINIINPANSCYGFKMIGNSVLAIMQSSNYIYVSEDGGDTFEISNLSAYATNALNICKDSVNNRFSVMDSAINRIIIQY